jgi:hypothetical protein
LLDQIALRARVCNGCSDLLHRPAHAASLERLLDHVAELRAAYEPGLHRCDPAEERPDIERFFLGLPDELAACCLGPSTRSAAARPAARSRLGA